MAHKRRQSVSEAPERSPKRRAQSSPKEVIVIDSDEDDGDLESILALIKQQEQSEALARQLQAEWTNSHQAPQAGQSRQDEPIIIEDDPLVESDEALARRLQAEWAVEDPATEPEASASCSSREQSHPSASGSRVGPPAYRSDNASESLPNDRLRTYEDLFVSTRKCTKCQKDTPSPRGYVRVLCLVFLCTMTHANTIGRILLGPAASSESCKAPSRGLSVMPDRALPGLPQSPGLQAGM